MEKKTSWRIGIIALLCCALVLCAVWAAVWPGEPADQPVAAADASAEQDNNESAAADASSESLTERDQGWISDIRFLQQTFTDEHPAPFWLLPQEDFDRQIDELIDQVPQLSDLEIGMELQRIVAQIGDQHSHVYFYEGLSAYPVDFYMNDDGTVYLYQIRSADFETNQYILDYYQVVQINNVDIQYIINRLRPLSSSGSSAYGYMQDMEFLLCYRDVLKEIGIPCEGDTDTFTLLDEQKQAFDIELAPFASSEETKLVDYIDEKHLRDNQPVTIPLLLQNQQQNYWYKYLEDEKTLFFSIAHFDTHEDKNSREIFEKDIQRMYTFFEEKNAEKLVIDLRGCPGGEAPLANVLIDNVRAKLEISKNTYILINSQTYSAGVVCARELSEECTLVGAPTGGTPWGFSKKEYVLPYSELVFNCGHFYYDGEIMYENALFHSPQFKMINFFPPEWESTVMPDVYISTNIQDLAEGRDPALEWVLAQ